MVHAPRSLGTLVDPAHTAVLVIDMQNDVCSPRGKLAKTGGDISAILEIIPRLAAFLDAARDCGVRVIFVNVVQAADGSTLSESYLRLLRSTSPAAPFSITGTWGAEILPELKPGPDEPVVTKHRSGSFTNTTLDTLLRSMRIRTVVVVGEQTPGCVEATVRQAADLDYDPVVVTDCIAAYNTDLHAAAMKVMTARWDSATSTEITATWRRSSRPRKARARG